MDWEENVASALLQLKSALDSNTVDSIRPSLYRVFIDGMRWGKTISPQTMQEASTYLLTALSKVQFCNDIRVIIATAYSNAISFILKDPKLIYEHFLNLFKLEDKGYNIYLCHAVIQSNNSYWKQNENTSLLLQQIFEVVRPICCAIDPATYLAFKILYNLIVKINFLYPDGKGVDDHFFRRILDIVVSNWENPLTGVRQQNSLVFGQLLELNEDLWHAVLPQSKGFDVPKISVKHQCLLELILSQTPWSMKSKYFMITGIVQASSASQIMESYRVDLVKGLILSLSEPRLVSAGADLYQAVLSGISLSQWHHFYLKEVTRMISQPTISLELEYLFDHWMHQTIQKFPLLVDELVDISSMNSYSYLSLLRIARKEGLPISSWERMDKVKLQLALESSCDKSRSLAFSLLCISTKSSILPEESEFEMVKLFLRQNINSDNSALRQNLLKSFLNLIIQIRATLIYLLKIDHNFNSPSTNHCFHFLDWLHSFMLFSLKSGSNYQRKITALELYKIILTHFGEQDPRERGKWTRKGCKVHLSLKMHQDKLLWNYTFDSQESLDTLIYCLFDEDNNIRTIAANLIMSQFKLSDKNISKYKELYKSASALSSGQVFYKAESGAVILHVLFALTSKCSYDELKQFILNGHKSFSDLLLTSIEAQVTALKKDLYQAVIQNSFLYGTLLTLDLIICDTNCAERVNLGNYEKDKIISILEDSMKYFVSILFSQTDSDTDDAPSFGEMGMAVANVVDSSAVTQPSEDDRLVTLHLTAAQQLVLNCVWLNLKVCSQLLSHLVISADLPPDQVSRCVNAIVCVLRRCRHKGAIESAGLALYHVARHVTSCNVPELVDLPSKLLDEVLEIVIGGPSATVSRRSAGLAILVHKLVTGDSRPSKPLLHESIVRLLSVAAEPMEGGAVLADLPQGRALHLLRTLVEDAGLRQSIAPYTTQVALLAIANLASPVWTIRNGALQLFGALVPALVGQKPHQDGAAMSHQLALEELHNRAHPLTMAMLSELSRATESDSIKHHSKLMPLLTVFNSLTVGLHTKLCQDLSGFIEKFKDYFETLFQSNIFHVRKLSAKAHSLFLTSAELVPMIEERVEKISASLRVKENNLAENEMHGYVLNIRYLLARFDENKCGMKVLLDCEERVADRMQILANSLLSSHHSYFVKAAILEVNSLVNRIPIQIEDLPSTSIGFPHFMNELLRKNLKSLSKQKIVDMVEHYLFGEFSYDFKLSLVKALLGVSRDIRFSNGEYTILFVKLGNFLVQYSKSNSNEITLAVLQVMVKILDKSLSNLRNNMFCSDLLCLGLEVLNSSRYSSLILAYFIAVLSGIVSDQSHDKQILEKLSNAIYAKSQPDYDEDVRIIAAKSMSFLANNLLKLKSDNGNPSGINVWKACVNFLQDEVPEVRVEANRFVALVNFEDSNKTKNCFLSLELTMKCSFMYKLMTPLEVLDCLWEIVYVQRQTNDESMISNPFDHGEKNIYAEENVVLDMFYHSIQNLMANFSYIPVMIHKCKLANELKLSKCALDYVSLVEKSLNGDDIG